MKRLLLAILFLGSLASAQVLQMPQGGTGVTSCPTAGYVLTCKTDLSGWEVDAPGAGLWLSNVVLPNDVFASSIDTHTGVETVTFQNQNPHYFFMGSNGGSYLTPIMVQAKTCVFGLGEQGSPWPCAFDGATHAGNLIFATALVSDTGDGTPVYLTVSDGTNTYTTIDCYGCNVHDIVEDASFDVYAKNIAGGAVTVVVASNPAKTATPAVVSIMEISGLDTSTPLEQFGWNVNTPPQSVTTTATNQIVVGAVDNRATDHGAVLTSGSGFTLASAANTFADYPGSIGGALNYLIVEATGTYTPRFIWTPPGAGSTVNFTVSFKAASVGAGGQPPTFRPVLPEDFSGALIAGTPIFTEDVTTAFAGNDSASALYNIPAGSTRSMLCTVYVDCGTQVSGATVTPELLFTSHSSTAEKLTGQTATCTTLGTGDLSSQVWPIRAKGGTSIYLKTTIANSPDYDVSAACGLQSTQ